MTTVRLRLYILSIGLALACATLAAQTGLTVRTVYPPPGTPGFEGIAKQEVYRTEKGKLFRVVHYYTPTAAQDGGVQAQIDDYGDLDYPVTFTMLFTDEFAKRSDFVRRVDKVDAADTLVSATFYISETVGFGATRTELDSLGDFPLRLISYYIEAHAHVLEDAADAYHIEGPYLTGTVLVRYDGNTAPISEKESYLISAWDAKRIAGVDPAAYTKRVLVHESAQSVWVCVRDDILAELAEKHYLVLQYYYVGRTIEGPTVIAAYVRTLP